NTRDGRFAAGSLAVLLASGRALSGVDYQDHGRRSQSRLDGADVPADFAPEELPLARGSHRSFRDAPCRAITLDDLVSKAVGCGQWRTIVLTSSLQRFEPRHSMRLGRCVVRWSERRRLRRLGIGCRG